MLLSHAHAWEEAPAQAELLSSARIYAEGHPGEDTLPPAPWKVWACCRRFLRLVSPGDRVCLVGRVGPHGTCILKEVRASCPNVFQPALATGHRVPAVGIVTAHPALS